MAEKDMTLIGETFYENFHWKTFTFPASLLRLILFRRIPKSLRSTFFSGAELFQFMLRIAS